LAARTASTPRSPAFSDLFASPFAAAFALLVPLVFLHRNYQPSWGVDVGATEANLMLSDLAVLGCGAIGLVAGIRRGFRPLRAGVPVLVIGGAFLALILAATAYGAAIGEEYRFAKHLVTALKFGEYGLLALAAPLAIRRCEELAPLLLTLTLWSAAASVGAILQFLGLVNELEGRRPGQREPSFVGLHDLAALSGATLALALIAIALDDDHRGRLLGAVAGAAGSVGLVLSGALAGFVGLVAAAMAAIAIAQLRRTLTVRRLAAVAGVVLLVGTGILALREADMRAFLRFLGVQPARDTESFEGESYVQRLVLGYIGTRIFLDRPLIGAGWQATSEEETYGPFLDDARRRYPDAPELAFPSPEHPWGVQNAYIQAGAELGVVGLVLFLGMFAVALFVAGRVAARAPPPAARAAAVPILWLLVTMGVWLGLGLVAGIPLVGLHWLALGLAAAAPSWVAGDA
jgi:O-antigen ligase